MYEFFDNMDIDVNFYEDLCFCFVGEVLYTPDDAVHLTGEMSVTINTKKFTL